MRLSLIAIAAAFLVTLLAGSASAQTQGFTTTSVHMRAGPGTSYPVVATLPQDATIEIFGCQTGYSWCDTGWNGARGWISSNYILTDSDGTKKVMNPVVAAALGIAIVDFSQVYWDNHYQAYPWFPYWNRYYHPYHPYHPAPGPYCYHAPQDPACHYSPYHPNRFYQPAPHGHSNGNGHGHHHGHNGGGHGGHHH